MRAGVIFGSRDELDDLAARIDPELDVGAADVDDEDVTGRPLPWDCPARWHELILHANPLHCTVPAPCKPRVGPPRQFRRPIAEGVANDTPEWV